MCREHGAVPVEAVRALETEVDSTASREVNPEVADAFLALGYTLQRELGRGGFGVVYAAVRNADGLAVALKAALPGQRDATGLLNREADATAAVGPPHAPAVFERGLAGGLPYLALELIQAPTLADLLIEAAGPLPLARFGADHSKCTTTGNDGTGHNRGTAVACSGPGSTTKNWNYAVTTWRGHNPWGG